MVRQTKPARTRVQITDHPLAEILDAAIAQRLANVRIERISDWLKLKPKQRESIFGITKATRHVIEARIAAQVTK